MDNHRNYYRILRVQPDASQSVIKQSYRSLMQKLRMHPDLGGEQWDAGILNQAYATLRDPKKRAAYDVDLLGRYNIKTLSKGGVIGPDAQPTERSGHGQHNDNQRNYYRILHVQPDAEPEVIKASHRALAGLLTGGHRQLLDEAFSVINDAEMRARYDVLIRSFTHAASVEKLNETLCPGGDYVGDTRTSGSTNEPENDSGATLETVDIAPYRAAINHYCFFCKTPHPGENVLQSGRFCGECASPLYSMDVVSGELPKRGLIRMERSELANCYEFWPGKPVQVSLENLSPVGVNFSIAQKLEVNQIIKLDATGFKAVAEVVYCRGSHAFSNIGAKFLSVEFGRNTGNFVSLTA